MVDIASGPVLLILAVALVVVGVISVAVLSDRTQIAARRRQGPSG